MLWGKRMFENDTTDLHERRIKRCKFCTAKIIWFKDQEGRNVPVDEDTVEADDEEFEPEKHLPHLPVCKSRRA